MIFISIKNDIVLSHIEALEAGTKISVRGLSAELNVSEGTVYKAIKEAEARGLVMTRPKSGTVRVSDTTAEQAGISLSDLVSLTGAVCVAGKSHLSRKITGLVLCDGDLFHLENRLSGCDPASVLCIAGERPDLYSYILKKGSNLLLTDGSRLRDFDYMNPDYSAAAVLTTSHSSYNVLLILQRHFEDRMPDGQESSTVGDWLHDSPFLYRDDVAADWLHFFRESFPLSKSFPVINDNREIAGDVDIMRAFTAPHSQKLSSLLSAEEAAPRVDASCTVFEAAKRMILSGSSCAAVMRDGKMEGVVFALDLLRSMMYSQHEKAVDISSMLVFCPDLSADDHRTYSVNIPGQAAPDLSVISSLIMYAAQAHLTAIGCPDCRVLSDSSFSPVPLDCTEGLQLTTSAYDGIGSVSVEAELYSDSTTFSRSMIVFEKPRK